MSTGRSMLDDHALCGLGISSILFEKASNGCSEILDLCMISEGNNIFGAAVKIKRRTYGEVSNLIYNLLSDINIKYLYVFDDDIDIRDIRERTFAFETRCRPEKDIIILPELVGASLDPSCTHFRHTSKVGFDCTIPWGETHEEREFLRKKHAKGWVPGVEKINETLWKGKYK